MSTASDLWKRYQQYVYSNPELGFLLDISRVRFPDELVARQASEFKSAASAMARLEAGEIANPDEHRMVGHYWLRAPELAPTKELTDAIITTRKKIADFAQQVRSGKIAAPAGAFEKLVVIGIGGSALGPQFIARALGATGDRLRPLFFDNTDPDGIERTIAEIGASLSKTLFVVISKSGGTPETRNGMLEASAACASAGLAFGSQAVAITQEGSVLDKLAVSEKWLARFPMWDWVGGRTSVMSAVGLVPMALQGLDVDQFLAGAAAMDKATRGGDLLQNPAALLAFVWRYVGQGKGTKDMVILPYKDRLELFSRYLQQLVMESLGKEKDRQGKTVHQGIAVYGNKGSTDQHAYVQQLRDGVPNFFATFIEVLRDREGAAIDVEPNITSGDYLSGLLQGTRKALYENGRDSVTITIDRVTPYRVGELIALYERAVGLYAELIDINAYHQPGVEAGKKAARAVLDLQLSVVKLLGSNPGGRTAEEIATELNRPDDAEVIAKICAHLAANPGRHVGVAHADPHPAKIRYSAN